MIATSSSPEKLDRLRQLGADHVINYVETPEWGRRAKEITGGRGVDLVVEVVASNMYQSVAACRMNGRISLVGALGGIKGEVPLARVFTQQLRIEGLRVGSRADQEDMIQGLAATGIKPVVDCVLPLEQLSEGYERQAAHGHFGKICIEI